MYPITLLSVAQGVTKTQMLLDALPHIAGMIMVMVTLAILWGICALTAKLVQILSPASPAPATSPAKAPPPADAGPLDDRTPPELVAVIAAAVATVIGKQPHRIVSIKPMSTNWEKAGRQSVLTSHRIR